MIRTLVIAGVSSLATAAVLMAGFAMNLPGMARSAVASQLFPHQTLAAQLPPEIRDLAQLAPAERFGHFKGVQATFTDVNNVAHTVTMVPGTVQSVNASELTMTPNDASLGAAKTYKLTSDTVIRRAAQSWSGGQTQAQLSTGDKVVVVTLDGNQPRAVIVGGPNGFGPGHRFGQRSGS